MSAKRRGGIGDRPEFRLGDPGRGDGIVGEGGEAAVGREEHALGAEDLDCAISLATISSTLSTRSCF